MAHHVCARTDRPALRRGEAPRPTVSSQAQRLKRRQEPAAALGMELLPAAAVAAVLVRSPCESMACPPGFHPPDVGMGLPFQGEWRRGRGPRVSCPASRASMWCRSMAANPSHHGTRSGVLRLRRLGDKPLGICADLRNPGLP